MIQFFKLTLAMLSAAAVVSAASAVVHQEAPPLCSKKCRVSANLCKDRDAFGKAMVQQCTDDDTREIRICSKCSGRTNKAQDILKNCMLLTARAGQVFGVPRGDVTVNANMDGVSIFDASVNQGALIWRGDIKNSLICKAGSDGAKTIFQGKVEKTHFPLGIKAIGEGTVRNTNPFFGPRFFLSKGAIAFAGDVRNNKFGKLEADGKITFRKVFADNKIKAMTARSGFSIADSMTGNKLGRVSALTPDTAPDFESNFDIERIGIRGEFDETAFSDNDCKFLLVDGSCSIAQGALVADNEVKKFRGDDQDGCGSIFQF